MAAGRCNWSSAAFALGTRGEGRRTGSGRRVYYHVLPQTVFYTASRRWCGQASKSGHEASAMDPSMLYTTVAQDAEFARNPRSGLTVPSQPLAIKRGMHV